MATFTTKFNTGDSAYLVDATTGALTTFVISEIFVKQGLAYGNSIYISYRVRQLDNSVPALNREYDEASLYTASEAQILALQILAQLQANIKLL